MVGDALGCCEAEVPDHVEGGLKVLLVRTAAVQGEEGYRGDEIRASVCCEPGEAADQGLVGFLAFDEGIILLVDDGGGDAVDGTTGLVRSGDRVEVFILEAMAFHDVLGISFLRLWRP